MGEWVRNSILGPYILSQAGGSEQGHRVSTAQLLRIAEIQLNITTFDSVIKELMRRGYAVHVESTTTESKDSHEDPASLPDGPCGARQKRSIMCTAFIAHVELGKLADIEMI